MVNLSAEEIYIVIKTEFLKNKWFKNLDEFVDYINLYNNHKIHSFLNQLFLMYYKENIPKKLILIFLPLFNMYRCQSKYYNKI